MSADFDKAIDRAVREMLDVEPPAGLRRRVLTRLPAAGSRLPASGWVLGAVAAAALVILAIFLARSTPRQPETTTTGRQQPVTAPATTTPMQPHTAESPAVQAASHPQSDRRVVAAAVAASAETTFDNPPAPGFPRLPALTVPELSLSSIRAVAPVEGPGAIATDPIATPSPLVIEPLPDQGRQSQE